MNFCNRCGYAGDSPSSCPVCNGSLEEITLEHFREIYKSFFNEILGICNSHGVTE